MYIVIFLLIFVVAVVVVHDGITFTINIIIILIIGPCLTPGTLCCLQPDRDFKASQYATLTTSGWGFGDDGFKVGVSVICVASGILLPSGNDTRCLVHVHSRSHRHRSHSVLG